MAFGNVVALVILGSLPLHVVKALRDESQGTVKEDCGCFKKNKGEDTKDCSPDSVKAVLETTFHTCTNDRKLGIGTCAEDSLKKCCPKTCCELSKVNKSLEFDLPCPKETNCGLCKNKGQEAEFQDCHVDSVKAVLETTFHTCTNDRKLGIGMCAEDSLKKCCPKTCCELSKTDEKVEFELECPTEKAMNEIEFQSTPIVSHQFPQKQEQELKATLNLEVTTAIETTSVAPTPIKTTSAAPTPDIMDKTSNAAKVCEIVQKELAKKSSKRNDFSSRFKENPETYKLEYSKKHCATAPVFEKDNDEDMVKIKGGTVIKVLGSALKDGKITDSTDFTVNFDLYVPRQYKNGCSWSDEKGKCEYAAS